MVKKSKLGYSMRISGISLRESGIRLWIPNNRVQGHRELIMLARHTEGPPFIMYVVFYFHHMPLSS
jgi:hypothetical protein